MNFRLVLLLTVEFWSLIGAQFASGQVPDGSPRMTPLVRVIQKAEPAVVALFIPDEDKRKYSSGTGAIVHPRGYAITNNHVVKRDEGFAILRGKPVRFKVVGRSPEKDLAVIRLRDHQGHLPVVPIGHSHDVLNGETVAVVGNPGGRGITVTSGIVSSVGRQLTSPSALWASQFDGRWRDDYIQYDAATNRGNSGGPLINMNGELIGVVAALLPDEQNSSFAIPADRVRKFFKRIVEPELRHSRFVGIDVNPQADETIVTEVASGSPAAVGVVRVGDVIVSVESETLAGPMDWWLSLDQHLPSGQSISVVVRRGEKNIPIEIKTKQLQPQSGIEIAAEQEAESSDEEAKELVEPGLRYEFFEGEFKILPDFEKLTAARSGKVTTLDMTKIQKDREDYFAVRLDGFLKVAEDGLYRLGLNSDDGSRLSLHGEVFIDHDGNHPPMTLSRLVRLKAGLHPIEIEYFEGYGENVLAIELDRLGDGAGNIEPTFMHLAE